MSDIRFKISGDSTPFLAELYEGTIDSGSLIKSQIIEYSGITDVCNNHTCVIFDGLSQETNYEVKITDNIMNTFCANFQTLSNPEVTDPEPTELNINLLGNVSQRLSLTTDEKFVSDSKYVDITPTLKGDECIKLNFTAVEIEDPSISNNGITSDVFIYKRCGSSGNYNEINYDNDTPFSINMGEGDSICYDLYTKIEKNEDLEQTACAKLVLNDVQEVSGFDYGINSDIENDRFDIIIENGTTTTTTTSTTTITTTTTTEEPTYEISASPSNTQFGGFNAHCDVTINTNGYDYNIGDSNAWISTQKLSPTTLRIQVPDYDGEDRLGSVTVLHSEDDDVTATIGVLQLGGVNNGNGEL